MSTASRIVLGLGAACDPSALRDLLGQQQRCRLPDATVRVLPWSPDIYGRLDIASITAATEQHDFEAPSEHCEPEEVLRRAIIRGRFDRWRRGMEHEAAGDGGKGVDAALPASRSPEADVVTRPMLLCDVASSYLPYVEAALQVEPDIRCVVLKCTREEAVDALIRWQSVRGKQPTDHFCEPLPIGHARHFLWSRAYPKFDVATTEDGIARYWEEYERIADELARRHPTHVRQFELARAFIDPQHQRELLAFIGILPDEEVNRLKTESVVSTSSTANYCAPPTAPSRCVVLVPFSGKIVGACETALAQLEKRGYHVRRVPGYSAIDQGRSQMATDALLDGYEETLWVDSDIGFTPDDVDRLRAHGLPISCGLYAKKGTRDMAFNILPHTEMVTFGKSGGLHEVLYAGAGFLHVRRDVYWQILQQCRLPVANEWSGRPTIPFFLPMIREKDDGTWYLGEDIAFCHRARSCGFQIIADTTVRLFHYGEYGYSWEDAGMERKLFETFRYGFRKPGT